METVSVKVMQQKMKQEFQSGEQLKEDGDEPTKEMAKAKLSEEEAGKQQLSEETADMESTAEW
jgi:hypothetical protein